MGFQQGLSGINAAATNLDVIANNIANASVVGFKASQVEFADVFASALDQSGAGPIGIGVQVKAVAQRFSQGGITVTSNPLDIAINGTGFFRMSDNGVITYTRNGQFHLDSSGYIVDSDKRRLTGYGVDSNGNVLATSPVELQVPMGDIAPSPTANFSVGLNLDARAGVLDPAAFDMNRADTYTASTSGTIYDSLGNPHVFTLYFVKSGSNRWEIFAAVDGAATGAGLPIGVTIGGGASQVLDFNTDGSLMSAASPISISVDLDAVAAAQGKVNGATSPLDFSLNLSGATQFGAGFSVNALSQDGYTSGRLSGFRISSDGVILGHYSNGQNKPLGQVVLASFNNQQGLKPIGRNQWEETSESGLPILGVPQSGTMGTLQSGAVEESNVDLTAELVSMITAQRVYQANAQSIKTQDAVLQTLLNLR